MSSCMKMQEVYHPHWSSPSWEEGEYGDNVGTRWEGVTLLCSWEGGGARQAGVEHDSGPYWGTPSPPFGRTNKVVLVADLGENHQLQGYLRNAESPLRNILQTEQEKVRPIPYQ